MKSIFPFSTALAVAFTSNAVVFPAVAQSSPMEHVLVSVPLHKKTAETALPVTVLSGDELRRSSTSTLGDTLQSKPGLASASFGPGVGQPVIRGQQGPRVTVLQNGTSSADASSVSADHANSVEPMLADSIEILRGPATLLYGGGAIGGVVNIVDNRIPTSLPEATTGGIEYRYNTAANRNVGVFRVDSRSGDVAWHVDGLVRDWQDLEIPGSAQRIPQADEEEQNVDTVPNTDGQGDSLTLGSSYHFDKGFVGLAVNRMNNEYGIPTGAHEHEEVPGHMEDVEHGAVHDQENEEHEEGEEGGIRLDVQQTRWDGALHLHEPIPQLEVVRGFLTYTDYEHEEIEPDGAVGTRYENNTFETRLEIVHQPVGAFHGVFGLQGKLGEFSALGEEAFVPRTDNSELGLFLVEDYHAGDWTYEAGLRVDQVERDPDTSAASAQDFTALSISGSLVVDIADQWRAGLALSRAERAPAAEELYSNIEASAPNEWIVHAATDAIELGNPDLDTEVSNNVDVSLRWMPGSSWVDIKLFYNDFADYINLRNTGTAVGDTEVFTYAQNDARFYGLEVDSEFTLVDTAAGELVLGLFADSVRAKLDGGGDVPRQPPERLGGRLNWESDAWALWSLLVFADDQDRPGDNELPSKGYTRWDIGTEYRLDVADAQLLVSLELKNIADEEIRLSTSFLRDLAPEAGRSATVAFRYSF